MAKSDAAETDKKSEGGKKAPRKAFKKRGEKRVVHHGYAPIRARGKLASPLPGKIPLVVGAIVTNV